MNPTLKDFRDESGLSQSQVAEALGIPAYQLVSNWERGKSRPNLDHIIGLAKLFEKSTEQIVKAIQATHTAIVNDLQTGANLA